MEITLTSLKEFNKCYDILRTDILKRHGFKKGDKVRLNKAIGLFISYDGDNFINTSCYTIIDMKDKIKMYELSNSKYIFKLKTLV